MNKFLQKYNLVGESGEHSKVWFAVVCLTFLGAQVAKSIYLAPPPEYIWDNIYLWDWARNVSYGNFAPFVKESHHMLRWADWLFAAVLIDFFGDEVFIYYISSLIPSTTAALVFAYVLWRVAGSGWTLVFLILWLFDQELNRATFQLLPNSQALLPISLLLLCTANLARQGQMTRTYLLLISALIFWVYGAKETYLAFAPAVVYVVWQVGGLRSVARVLGLLALAYCFETLFFKLIDPEFSIFGRVHAVISGSLHIDLMFENPSLVRSQTRYFDSGITMRWMSAVGTGAVVFFAAFVLAVLNIEEKGDTNNRKTADIRVLSMMLLSFMIVTTLFVISFSPLRLGQPLVGRYVAMALPFSYMVIAVALFRRLVDASLFYKGAVLCALPFFLAPSINRTLDYTNLSIVELSKRYNVFAGTLNDVECVRGHSQMIVSNQLDFTPYNLRSERVKTMLLEKHGKQKGKWYYIGAKDHEVCKAPHTIHRTYGTRY